MSSFHSHSGFGENERKTLWVIVFTVITMGAEIVCGYLTHSMALLADGYHMGTHAVALGVTYIAYVFIRKYEGSEKFPNGTDKIGVLAAYSSSIFLGLTGIWIIVEAVQRFFNPLQIQFDEALLVAVIGCVVNGICIFIMENHASAHEQEDYNFKAAYYHILADILTSVLAIAALIAGKYMNIVCFDSLIGIIGGLLIIRWAYGLLKKAVPVLIDMKTSAFD